MPNITMLDIEELRKTKLSPYIHDRDRRGDVVMLRRSRHRYICFSGDAVIFAPLLR